MLINLTKFTHQQRHNHTEKEKEEEVDAVEVMKKAKKNYIEDSVSCM